MRIIGEISHPLLKITVFKMNEKTSVKFEHDLIEHIIKFREGSGIETAEDVQNLLDENMLADIINHIGVSSQNRGRRLQTLLEEKDGLNFPVIQ